MTFLSLIQSSIELIVFLCILLKSASFGKKLLPLAGGSFIYGGISHIFFTFLAHPRKVFKEGAPCFF